MYLSIMQGVKYILLICIFGLSTAIGLAISKSYENRVIELKEFKNILNIIKTKIKFTYEPLADIFRQISNNNETNVEKVVSKVETGAYYCSAKALIVNENQVLLATVLEIIVVVAVIAISLGLSLIVYSIIKNILNSQHKAFLIMRSLGIDGNKIAIQVYIELAFTLVVNFVIAFVLWCVLKLRNFGGFFASMHKATFGTIFLIYVVSIVVFAILGFKYSSSVIKSSIVNKEME